MPENFEILKGVVLAVVAVSGALYCYFLGHKAEFTRWFYRVNSTLSYDRDNVEFAVKRQLASLQKSPLASKRLRKMEITTSTERYVAYVLHLNRMAEEELEAEERDVVDDLADMKRELDSQESRP